MTADENQLENFWGVERGLKEKGNDFKQKLQ